QADFSEFQISNVSDLAVPMRLQSHWQASGPARVNAGIDLGRFLAAPTRNRPMLINDGQPLEFRQIVHLKFSAPASKFKLPEFQAEVAGAKFSIQSGWLDDRTMERVAVCEIRDPRISPE